MYKLTLVALAAMSVMSVSHAANSGIEATTGESKDVTQDIKGALDYGIYAHDGGVINFSGKDLVIDTTPGTWGSGNVAVGARVSDADKGRSVVTLGKAGVTENISINVVDDSETSDVAIGLWARGNANDQNGGLINVNTKTLRINGKSANGWIYGIYAQNATTEATGEKASIVINAEQTVIDVKADKPGCADAIVAMSEGYVEINGNLYVNSDYAVIARGDAEVYINRDGRASNVQINGDIDFNYDGGSSQTKVDATVEINLVGENSYWNGSAGKSFGSADGNFSEDSELYKVTGLKLNVSDGAQWIPSVVTEITDKEDSGSERIAINDLTLNKGVIVLSKELVESEQDVLVEDMIATDAMIRTYVETDEDGKVTKTGSLNVQTIKNDGASLSVIADNMTADNVKDSDAVLTSLAHVVEVQGGSSAISDAVIQSVITEGDVLGEITQSFDANGDAKGEASQKTNTKLSSFGSVNVTNLMQWRHEMNDLTKRMGELRLSPEGVGTWARLYGSEQKYGDMGTETKNTTIQVGADYDVGAGWKVGAAFSYTDSSSSMDNGSADGDMYGFALYGTWLNDDGQFVDLIAKYSRLSTDFTAGNMSGDYDNNAYSVSVEYGWHLKLGDVAFVEPQAELTYGQVKGDDFTSSNNVRIEQDDVDSLIGRIGVRGGFLFPENKGNVYLRASVLHDFDGETSFKASNETASTSMSDDLGGTWYEFGIGANFNLTDATYTYVDLEKTTGGEVQENWRWNIGLRHVW